MLVPPDCVDGFGAAFWSRPDRDLDLLAGATIRYTQVLCADCGCRVDRGTRIESCPEPDCCCRDLPTAEWLRNDPLRDGISASRR